MNLKRPPNESTETKLPFASYYKTMFSKTDEIQLAKDVGFHPEDMQEAHCSCSRVDTTGNALCSYGLLDILLGTAL